MASGKPGVKCATPRALYTAGGGGLGPLAGRHENARDAPAPDLDDGEVVAADRDSVSGSRHATDVRGDEAAERADVGGLGQLHAEPLGDVVDQAETVEHEPLRRLFHPRRLAGVSQGAVSRLEAGRGLATPMLVILKINLALRASLRDVDPTLLNDDLRRVLEIEERISPRIGDAGFDALPVTKDPLLEDLIRLYRRLPDRQRPTFLSVVRAAAEALAGSTPSENEQKS